MTPEQYSQEEQEANRTTLCEEIKQFGVSMEALELYIRNDFVADAEERVKELQDGLSNIASNIRIYKSVYFRDQVASKPEELMK